MAAALTPELFDPTLPEADLVFNLALNPAEQADTLAGLLELRNDIPAPINGNGIPITAINGNLNVDINGKLHLQDIDTELSAGGHLKFNGSIDGSTQQMAVTTAVSQFKLQDILKQTLALTLNGTIQLSGSLNSPQADWRLRAGQTDTSGWFHPLSA